jgi:hypothetical protein
MFPSSGSMDHASWCPYSYVFRLMLPHLTVGEIPCDSDSLGWQNALVSCWPKLLTLVSNAVVSLPNIQNIQLAKLLSISKHRKWFESIQHPISSFLLPSNSSKHPTYVQPVEPRLAPLVILSAPPHTWTLECGWSLRLWRSPGKWGGP